ncbi:cysteine-rich CWC family protein [Pseudoduganella lutea]|uniref:Cysteine-rich CWC family protein n=1 Tax=Pseudoduganella lutea TaxID=321985 RepID=A0A4P6KZF1_9BURK|nr:cysteine-rich CWC family protein [Pseudoduganella lutea]QBE63698.1 hypothetical protein EWM63_12515 [Pseudoduganella lutea]
MSTCERCGATFHCAMADGKPGNMGNDAVEPPCWCTLLPPAVPVPRQEGAGDGMGEGTAEGRATAAAVGCWCPDCLKAHIAALARPHPQ